MAETRPASWRGHLALACRAGRAAALRPEAALGWFVPEKTESKSEGKMPSTRKSEGKMPSTRKSEGKMPSRRKGGTPSPL